MYSNMLVTIYGYWFKRIYLLCLRVVLQQIYWKKIHRILHVLLNNMQNAQIVIYAFMTNTKHNIHRWVNDNVQLG